MVKNRLWRPVGTVILLASLTAAAAAGRSQSANLDRACVFPIWEALDFTGLSIVNPTGQTAEYAITLTDAAGTRSETGRLTLAAQNERAFLLGELPGISNLSGPGWIRIDSAETTCTAYLAGGRGRLMAATEGTASLSSSILLTPVLVQGTGFIIDGNMTETFTELVNPSDVQINASLQLFSMDGTAQATVDRAIPPRGSRTIPISQTFRNVLPSNDAGGVTFAGYLCVTADAPIAAWQRIQTPESQALMRGQVLEEVRDAGLAMIPHFAEGGPNLWSSVLHVTNPSSSPVTLEFTAADARGRTIAEPVQRTMGPGEALRASVLGLFQVVLPAVFPPPLVTGSILIRELNNGPFRIVGDIEMSANRLGGRESGMLSSILVEASRTWLLPFATSADTHFTGYAIANPNENLTIQTDVTVELLNPDGTVANTSSVSLSPAAQFTAVIPEGFPGGYVRIRATMPIFVTGSLGTWDLKTLDQLPAVPAND